MNEVEAIEREALLELRHKKALKVCQGLADAKSLSTLLATEGLSPSEFFTVKRNSPDVRKAWEEAKEIKAEVQMARLDDLNDQLIDENGLTKDIYSGVTKNMRWSIEKLAPRTYGTKAEPIMQGTVNNTVNILHSMSDSQLLELLGQGESKKLEEKPVDNVIEPEYNEVNEDSFLVSTSNSTENPSDSSEHCPHAPSVHTEPNADGVSFDLNAFEDL